MFRDPRVTRVPEPVRTILHSSTGAAAGGPPFELQPDDLGLLDHHGVVDLALDAVDRGSVTLEDHVRARLVELNERLQHRSVAVEARAVWAVGALDAAGIEVRILKGVAVASVDHPHREIRVFKDIDLLVRSASFADAVRALEGVGTRREMPEPFAGYDRRFGKGAAMVCADGMELDLHRTFSPGAFGQRVDLDDVWAAGEPFELGGTKLVALDRHARVLHALLHIALSPQPKAIEMLDLRRAIEHQDFDKDRLLTMAERWGVAPAVTVAIDLTVAWLGRGWLPSAIVVWAENQRLSRMDSWLLEGYVGKGASSPRRSAGLLVALGWTDRCRYGFGYARRLVRRGA